MQPEFPFQDHLESQDNVEWGVCPQGSENSRQKSTQPIPHPQALFVSGFDDWVWPCLPSLTSLFHCPWTNAHAMLFEDR
jgi:hypothetical protein